MSAPDTVPIVTLHAAAGIRLTPDQTRRAMCLDIALDLVAGRSVPIQVVERIARWICDGGDAE